MNIQELQDEIEEFAKAKGWWKDGRTFGDDIALMHSELSEAFEEYRNGWATTTVYWRSPDSGATRYLPDEVHRKPEGIPIELADEIIRILHRCAEDRIDIVEALRLKLDYNRTRPGRHGGKKL